MPSLRYAGARIRRLLTLPAMRQRVLGPMAFNALILGTNLITGIIVARSLGPAGRGELAAILVLVQTASWLFSLGSAEAVAYHQSRHPQDGPRLIGSWLAALAPLGVLAVVVGELALPTLFSAQTSEAIELGRIYLLLSFVSLAAIVFNGVLLGDQRFLAYNVVRLLIPGLMAIGYGTLLLLGALTVESALIVSAGATVVSALVAAISCFSRHGIARPHGPLLRTTVWYGARVHSGSLAGFVNARLDLLIIPAFLAAANVGLYSVATNVSSIIATLTGTIAIIAMPIAARDTERSARTIVRTLHAVLLIGAVLGAILMILAEVALRLVYGSSFEAAAPALRILIPGEVLDAAATVLWSGLLAANRPLLSSVAFMPSALLTVVGLLLFLRSGGITTAATVTTCANALAFVLTLTLFRRATGLEWRSFIRAPSADVGSTSV